MADLRIGSSAFTANGWPGTFYTRVTFRVAVDVCYGEIKEKTMTLQRQHSSSVETPIERIFRKIMEREMTKKERRWLRLKPAPIITLRP
jgi:hypothetical protein